MNIVFFLGAGFSKPFGLPVMCDFYHHALSDASPLDPQQKTLIRQLRLQVRNCASMLHGPEDNLEHLLSVSLFADNDWPGKSNDTLIRALRKIYCSIKPRDLSNILKGPIRTLVGFESRHSHHYSVITTNYDVLAEFCFSQIGIPLGLPIEWEPGAAPKDKHVLYDPRGSTRILCKLHGSANWHIKKTEEAREIVVVDGRVHTLDDFGPNEPIHYRVPTVCLSNYNDPPTPIIVPPTFYKGYHPTSFNPIWKAAKQAISRANRLVFVGYSFPPSDTHMKYFLGSALFDNTDLRHIDILDPFADSIVERLRKEADYGHTFKEKLRSFNGKWEESQYDATKA